MKLDSEQSKKLTFPIFFCFFTLRGEANFSRVFHVFETTSESHWSLRHLQTSQGIGGQTKQVSHNS